MIGATPLIEQNVPVGPSLGPRIEIVDHRPAVRLSQAPAAIPRRIEARRCALGKEDVRSEEHTSELQSRLHLVCRLLLEKKKKRHLRRQMCEMYNVNIDST